MLRNQPRQHHVQPRMQCRTQALLNELHNRTLGKVHKTVRPLDLRLPGTLNSKLVEFLLLEAQESLPLTRRQFP